MNRFAIGLMARAPSSPGKTRLAPHIDEARLRALREAFFADALLVVEAVPHVDPFVFVTPADAAAEIGDRTRPSTIVLPQDGEDLGARMRHALHVLLVGREYDGAMLVGTDVPLLTVEHLQEALTLLRTRGGVVLGPADDGGYYLIGMTGLNDAIFDRIAWGSDTVLLDTVAAAERQAIDLCLIRGAYDVDTINDLRRAERDVNDEPPGLAPHLREWLVRSTH